MRVTGVGHLFLALGFAVVGAIGLGAQDFVLNQEPVPKDLPWREVLACINGAILLFAGLGLFVPRTAKASALALTAFVGLWVIALWIPRAVANPAIEGRWLGVGEDSTVVAGGWLIFCAIAGRNDWTVRAAQILFGVAIIPIGLSHFFYLQGAAALIPAWFPFHIPSTLLGGAGHIAAGLAILLGIVPRLAATLEAIMQSLFTLIVWVSAVAATPASREDWANLFISTVLTGAAWAVARSYQNAPWVSMRVQMLSSASRKPLLKPVH